MLKIEKINRIQIDNQLDEAIARDEEICDLDIKTDDFYNSICNHCRSENIDILDIEEDEFKKCVNLIWGWANESKDKVVTFSISK